MNCFKQRIIILLILLLTIDVNTYSQLSQYRFDYLTTEDGLSTNRIRGVYRDSKNYLWIFTETGLDKYDGYHFVKYRQDETREGTISSNDIRLVFEDHNNNIWVGTDNGLNLYDPKSDQFIVYKNNPKDTTSIDNDWIGSIYEDSKGNLWITTRGEFLNKWVPNTKTFKHYSFSKNLRDITFTEDSKGNMWMVTESPGIMQYNPETKNLQVYNTPDQATESGVKYILIDKENKIWIAVNGKGFFSFKPSTGKFEQYGKEGEGNAPNGLIFNGLIEEDNQHILIAVDQGGINRFNKVTNTFEYIVRDETVEQGLNSNGIWSLYRDFEGILWVGTSGGGINYYNPKKYQFELFRHNLNDPNSVSSNIIGCFYEDSQGMIWIGTDDNGLDVYNPKTGDFKHYKHNPSNPYSISSNTIRCISEDKNNDLWIGTWAMGFNRFDRETGRFYCYMPDKNNPSSISGPTIWHYTIDHKGVFWLAVHDVGIDLFEIEKGVFKRFRLDPDNPNALSNAKVWYVYEDDNNNIWLCTNDGLNLYNSENDNFIVYKDFPTNKIKCIVQNKEKNLWIGTEKGICLIKKDGTILETYDVTDGLAGDVVSGTVIDNQGNLWISTNNGISKFDPKLKTFKNYTRTDGLQDNAFFQQSFLKTNDGIIYFGGYKGFNSFHPGNLKNNDFIPPVYITDFKIFNEPVPIGDSDSPLRKAISETDEIILSWRQSVFSFGFTAINYTYSEKNEYAYMLEGFEKRWNYVGNKREATYTNLDPGEYTFKVKASNNDGVWNEEGASINIEILPPWWQTWWFRGAVLILLILTIRFLIKYRERKIKRDKAILEKKLKEGEEEINLQKKEVLQQSEELKRRDTAEKDQKWFNNGMIKVGNAITKNKDDMDKLSKAFMMELLGYLNAIQGAIFVLNEENEKDKYLELIYGYGLPSTKLEQKRVEIGENLVGACFTDKSTIILDELPKNYTQIKSGLGSSEPKQLVISPLVMDDYVLGVIEISTMNPLSENRVKWLKSISEMYAASLFTLKMNLKMSGLVEKMQQQAEEMQSQDEELRQNMEEVKATNEEAARREKELENLNKELSLKEKNLLKTVKEKDEALSKAYMLLKNKESEK